MGREAGCSAVIVECQLCWKMMSFFFLSYLGQFSFERNPNENFLIRGGLRPEPEPAGRFQPVAQLAAQEVVTILFAQLLEPSLGAFFRRPPALPPEPFFFR